MKRVERKVSITNMKSVKASTGTSTLDDVKDKLHELVNTIETMDDVEYESLKQILGDTILDKYMEDLRDLSLNI